MLNTIEGKNPKVFWKLIKKMQQWGKSDDGNDSALPPKSWLEHFQSLLNDGEDATSDHIRELETLENSRPFFSELDFRIENNEIEKALKRLNKKASPGIDKISGGLLYEGMGDLLPIFNLFFNKMFSHAMQPKMLHINYLNNTQKRRHV